MVMNRPGVLETRSAAWSDGAGLGARQILAGVIRIQSDQPWADGLMQRSLFDWEWGHGPNGGYESLAIWGD